MCTLLHVFFVTPTATFCWKTRLFWFVCSLNWLLCDCWLAQDDSMIFIQNARSTKSGGGFSTKKRLRVSNSSVVSLENVTAGSHGGAFTALGDVEIAGHSMVNMSNSHAETGHGGGFGTEKGLKVSNGSRLIIRNATAGNSGGGFYAKGRALISRSTVSIQNATARHGGGFITIDEVVIDEMSSVSISSSRSANQGGGFQAEGHLQVTNTSVLTLQNVTAQNYGGGFLAIGEVEIAGNSTVNISNSWAEAANGGGFDAEKDLKLFNDSRLIIRNATAGKSGGCLYMLKAEYRSAVPQLAFKMPQPGRERLCLCLIETSLHLGIHGVMILGSPLEFPLQNGRGRPHWFI